MKIIMIGYELYQCSDKTFKGIVEKLEEIQSKEWYLQRDADVSLYLDSIMNKLKYLGTVNFDFRL